MRFLSNLLSDDSETKKPNPDGKSGLGKCLEVQVFLVVRGGGLEPPQCYPPDP
jgi:hypothetical protein